MSQRLVINYQFDDEGQPPKTVFNADEILRVVFVPDGMDDNALRIYTAAGNYFGVFCSSPEVVFSVVERINNALTSNPGGRVVEVQLGADIFAISPIISG